MSDVVQSVDSSLTNSMIPIELLDRLSLHLTFLEVIALVLIALATMICIFRLIAGPTNPDRIVSADTLSVIATIMLCIIAALFQSALYLDVAMIYGILSFVGMIALAKAIRGN